MKKHILKENYERFFEKREFGDPLPTFEDVMKRHQINKLEEDWWDDMDASAQAQYIKAHPGSKQAQQADDDDYDMGVEPGSRDSGPWTPEDDPDFEHGPSLTSAPGRVPDEDDEDDEESSGRTGKELDQETLTVDGKQYRRISESVEKQPKPKHAFSEFYQRFKR